jgi:hypothetical protein
MKIEITPQPTDDERAAIDAALGQEARAERPSAWADRLLPAREDDCEPYPEGPPER